MEATAVSLARSVLDGVVSSVRSAVADEVARLLGVPKEVEFIRNELEMMRSFLKVASAHPDEAPGRSDTVRTWVKQVRDLAYDVEDCLLDFALYAARTSSSRAGSWLPGALAESHRIATRIRDLKASVEELNQRYHIAVDLPAAARAEEQAAMLPDHDVQSAELAFQESDIIGRKKEKADLTKLISRAELEEEQVLTRTSWRSTINSWLNSMIPIIRMARSLPAPFRPQGNSNGALRVVVVWGMGGMGKSSLVRMVHNDPVLLDEFDIGAWITVPHPLDNPEVFKRRLRKELGIAQNQSIELHLRDKRFRVIVDDLLSPEEWDSVWSVFQFENNK